MVAAIMLHPRRSACVEKKPKAGTALRFAARFSPAQWSGYDARSTIENNGNYQRRPA
jgi:hypothetical protein